MKEYTVKEVAEMFHTDTETVRRWIRNNKLGSVQSERSYKEGKLITEAMLQEFLKNYGIGKYASLATMSAMASLLTGGTAIAASVIAGAVIQGNNKKKALERAKIRPDDMLCLLQKEAETIDADIQAKRKKIKALQKEIDDSIKKRKEVELLAEEIRGTSAEKEV